jgi:hypothetical protein
MTDQPDNSTEPRARTLTQSVVDAADKLSRGALAISQRFQASNLPEIAAAFENLAESAKAASQVTLKTRQSSYQPDNCSPVNAS